MNRWVLVTLAVLALVFYCVLNQTVHRVRSRQYDAKVASAQLAQRAMDALRQYRDSLGVPIDSVSDPNGTGLIGMHSSPVTWIRSDLSDALTSTNPNMAAAIVEVCRQTGLRTGDSVAVSWDGSYPALNVVILAVLHTLGLVPRIVTAQSSGAWGANYPGFTWLDMESVLCRTGFWNYRSLIATAGAETDDGRGLPPEGRDVLAQTAATNGVRFLVPESLRQGVLERLAVYRGCRALFAVGNVAANSGDPMARLPSGVVRHRTRRVPATGLVGEMLDGRVPVVSISDPSAVAASWRLPVAPVPLPRVGEGRLFVERRYSVALASLFSLMLMATLVLVVRYDVESCLGLGSAEENKEAV